jgi:hypothetical protein
VRHIPLAVQRCAGLSFSLLAAIAQAQTANVNAPIRMAANSTASAPWSPPGDTPAAPAGPADFAKLPQITGLGIGLPIGEALSTYIVRLATRSAQSHCQAARLTQAWFADRPPRLAQG